MTKSDTAADSKNTGMPDLVNLFHALESPLLGFAYQMVKDEQLAQDIVQEAFIRLQKNLADVQQPKAWLYTTVRRLSVDPFADGSSPKEVETVEKGKAVRQSTYAMDGYFADAEDIALDDITMASGTNRPQFWAKDNGLAVQSNQALNVVIDQQRLMNYTDQTKQTLPGGNTKEDNETFRLLAARLVDQQQAVPGNPQAIQTIVPQQGQVVSFTRSLQINDQADLIIELKGKRSNPTGQAGLGLGMLLLLIGLAAGANFVSQK